ncbi:MAG TPA: DeoR/GlpR family DNA-binding transcription regulator [Tepidisphaeraceae bacterium]|jgi:DeoR/GlpR family transcriptional regulator of sugar metabolism|nr:DeoR/GlpR family DNA-binding transcription regulator [Tepidisphaeraceae bacterium]
MFVHDRHREIVDRLARRPRWTVTQLQREMRVSRSTLRRDLLELEERGDVVRVHGGVVHRDFLQGEPTFDRRGKQGVAAKRAIGAAAAAIVADNASVYLDAGTTSLEVGRRLLLRPDVKLFTHSLRLAADAASSDAPASVVLVGGEVRKVSQAVVGALTLDWLKQLRFDVAFVAASGVTAEGVSTTELSEAGVKQAIADRAAKVVLVADAAKWDAPAAVRFAAWRRFDTWVVDAAVPRAARAAAEAAGVKVIVAKEG